MRAASFLKNFARVIPVSGFDAPLILHGLPRNCKHLASQDHAIEAGIERGEGAS